MRLQLRIGIATAIGALVLWAAGGVVLCEGGLKAARRKVPDVPPIALRAVTWRPVSITARDGARLSAWLLDPAASNGGCVVLLHGVADSRGSESGVAHLLLQHGYAVLMTDGRAHGLSGGDLITYGILEADDVHRWVDWLIADAGQHRIYGFGESLGASVLLQSLAVEPRFRSVVAECPFADFDSIADYRVAQKLPPGLKFTAEPLVWSGLLWADWKYGLQLNDASPVRAVRHSTTPVLLIHGLADTNIPPEHSRRIRAANPKMITLWLVPNAIHTGAYSASPDQFESRVLNWFK